MSQTIFQRPLSGKNVIAGAHASGEGTINFNFASSTPPRSIRPFSTVPFSPDPNFVERPDALCWLRERAAYPGCRAALVGLGGIGKSQIAIHYAYEVRRTSPDTWVFWIHSSTYARFVESYRNIADRLQLPGRDDPKHSVLQLVYDWLCDQDNGPWMMVLDNADSIEFFFQRPSDIHSQGDRLLASFLPKTGRGSIVITTRNTEAAERLAGCNAIYKVPVMEKQQALELLRNMLGEGLVEGDGVMADLIDHLNSMPLAITQAAAFISRRAPRMSVSTYLHEFRRSDKDRASLLNKDAADLRRDESASNSIVTTWQITFNQIRHERPSAADLLSFMSCFNPQGIPESVLQAYTRSHGKCGKDETDKELDDDLDNDLDILRGYSLVEVTTERDVFKMHALVQFCTQVWLSSFGSRQQWKREFVKVMSHHYPHGNYETWTKCQRLDPHVEMIAQEELGSDKCLLRWAKLLSKAGWFRLKRGRYEESEAISRRALEAREKVLGPEHRGTLLSIHKLAVVLQYRGKYEESEMMNRRVLEAREKVLGRGHPGTISAIGTLASVLQDQRKYEESEIMNRQALELSKKILGEEHPDTLASINNLASVLQERGKYEESEVMNRRVLETAEKILGKDHPDVLKSMGNLANALRAQGKYEESEMIKIRVLEAREKVLGRDHPDTIRSTGIVAMLLRYQGKYEESRIMNRQALELSKQILGEEHPDTLGSINNLASVLHDQGKYEESEVMNRRVLEIAEKILGKDHPNVLISMGNLANALRAQGKYEESKATH